MDVKKSVKQVQKNPHIYCSNTCTYSEYCPKHMSRITYPDNEYLLALMKDTPYCLCEEE